MQYRFLSILIFCCLFVIACGNGGVEYQEQQKAHEQVMEIHDEVMPKISNIQRLAKKLGKLTQNETSELSQEVKTKVEQQIKALEDADEAMMSWMANYKKPKKDMPKSEALDYLAKEKVKIEKVRTMMLESIKTGEQLLSSVQQ